LFFFDDPDLLIRAAHDQGRITHKDPRCSAGAVAISGAVSLALRQEAISTESFISSLAGWTQTIEPAFATELIKLTTWISLPPDEAINPIREAGFDPEYVDDEEWKGISAFVVSSVLWSLYSFLRTPDNYWETICTAIGVGGDVDTTTAMAGAVSGAYLGIGAIPSDFSIYLTDRKTWGRDELIDLADQCYEIKIQEFR